MVKWLACELLALSLAICAMINMAWFVKVNSSLVNLGLVILNLVVLYVVAFKGGRLWVKARQ